VRKYKELLRSLDEEDLDPSKKEDRIRQDYAKHLNSLDAKLANNDLNIERQELNAAALHMSNPQSHWFRH